MSKKKLKQAAVGAAEKKSKIKKQLQPSKRRSIKCNDAHIRNAIELYLKSLSLIEDNEIVISYTQSTEEVEILLGREVV